MPVAAGVNPCKVLFEVLRSRRLIYVGVGFLHCELPLTVPKHHEGHAPKSRLFSNIPAREGGAEDEFFCSLRVMFPPSLAPRVYFSRSLFFSEIVRRLV